MIDTSSPAGSYRAALNPGVTCAVCRQSVCAHPDLEFAGIVPAHPLDDARRDPADRFGGRVSAPFHGETNG